MKVKSTAPDSMPENGSHQKLLSAIIARGIQFSTPEHRTVNREGQELAYVMNMLGLSLEADGLQLATDGMLHLLKRFRGTQLATIGTAAVPLLAACITASNGKYNGLMVRSERKTYGTQNQIDGNIDRSRPVIVIDDSIGSGANMLKCIEILEQNGLYVEGGACLVRFHWYTGELIMIERGYQLETLFDHDTDIAPRCLKQPAEERQRASQNPLRNTPMSFDTMAASEGLSAINLMRQVIEHYLDTEKVLRPPVQVKGNINAAGGLSASIRDRSEPTRRHARTCFMTFPEDPTRSVSYDLVLAGFQIATQLQQLVAPLNVLDRSFLSITLHGKLHPCQVADLDHNRYAITVRSDERPDLIGMGLPRMPGIQNTWHQFNHVRLENAGLHELEPYRLYRFSIKKIVEPGYVTPFGGVAWQVPLPWYKDPDHGGNIARQVYRATVDVLLAKPAADYFLSTHLPPAMSMLFISLYYDGHWRACSGSAACHSTEQILDTVNTVVNMSKIRDEISTSTESTCHTAGQDSGQQINRHDSQFDTQSDYPAPHTIDAAKLTVSVHILLEPHTSGELTSADTIPVYAHGRDALAVSQGDRLGLMLPSVALNNNFTPSQFVAEIIDKAGITRPPYFWTRYLQQCWTVSADKLLQHEGSSVIDIGEDPLTIAEQDKIYLNYLIRLCNQGQPVANEYRPSTDRFYGQCNLYTDLAVNMYLQRNGNRKNGSYRERLGKVAHQLLERQNRTRPEDADATTNDNDNDTVTIALLLIALCEELGKNTNGIESSDRRSVNDNEAYGLIETLHSWLLRSVDSHGRIVTAEGPRIDNIHQPGPYVVLYALCCSFRTLSIHDRRSETTNQQAKEQEQEIITTCLNFYLHRCTHMHRPGNWTWLFKAFIGWGKLWQMPELTDCVWRHAEQIIRTQTASGGFISGAQPEGLGYTTAWYTECLALAARTTSCTEREIADQWMKHASHGLQYLQTLTVSHTESRLLHKSGFAAGALRQSEESDRLLTSHTLAAAQATRTVLETEKYLDENRSKQRARVNSQQRPESGQSPA